VPYAQTNLQLFNQMRERGYTDQDLALVHTAYDVATQLFSGSYRGSGKPLLAHLVGTASILCALRVPAAALAAALLHAAYLFGEFGDGRRDNAPAKRDRLRASVGPQVEELIAAYDGLGWNRQAIPRLQAGLDRMTPVERTALLIRLANELEDHLDLGVLYCGNARQRLEDITASRGACVDMARRLGQPALAAELDRTFDTALAGSVPEWLRQPRDATYLLPPLSHVPRPTVWLRRLVRRHPALGLALHPRKLLGRLRSGPGAAGARPSVAGQSSL